MKPYKLVPYEAQAADVVARDSGERVGCVMKEWGGWFGYLRSKPGRPLSDGPRAYPLRADAAERVWQAHLEAAAQ